MTTPERSRGIDALRAFAALSVLVMHAGLLPLGQPRSPVTGGQRFGWSVYWNLDAGVDIFFVISGYLVAGPFVRALLAGDPLPGIRRYAVRRFARIMPAYWVALAAITLAPFVPWPGWQWLLHGLLLMNPFPGQLQQGLGVAWTLHVELAFYLLVPLAAMLLRRRHPGALDPRRLVRLVLGLMAGSALAAGAASFVPETSPWWRPANFSIPACLGLFGPGVLLAVARTPQAARTWPGLRRGLDQMTRRYALLLLGLATCVVSVGAELVPPPFAPLHRPLRAVLATLVLARLTRARVRHGAVVRTLAPLGTVSYGLYLWHFVVQRDLVAFDVWQGAPGPLGLAVDALVLFAVTLPIAVASWALVERPLLALARRERPVRLSVAVGRPGELRAALARAARRVTPPPPAATVAARPARPPARPAR